MPAHSDPALAELCGSFASVVVLPQLELDRELWTVPAKALADWLGRYHAWFLETTGIIEGRNVQLAYHRELLLSGPLLTRSLGEVETLAGAARSTGMAFSWVVPLAEVIDEVGGIRRLMAERAVGNLVIDVLPEHERFGPEACLRTFEELAGTGAAIGWVGDVALIKRFGLFDTVAANRLSITCFPRNLRLRDAEPRTVRAHPCRNRLRLSVDGRGNLYPCLPLVGIERCSLGTIWQPLEETGLVRRRGALDLPHIASVGPFGDGLLTDHGSGGLPVECALHRQQLQLAGA